ARARSGPLPQLAAAPNDAGSTTSTGMVSARLGTAPLVRHTTLVPDGTGGCRTAGSRSRGTGVEDPGSIGSGATGAAGSSCHEPSILATAAAPDSAATRSSVVVRTALTAVTAYSSIPSPVVSSVTTSPPSVPGTP